MAPRQEKGGPSEVLPAVLSARPSKFSKAQVYAHIAKYASADDRKAWAFFLPTVIAYIGFYFLPSWVIPIHALISMRYFICFHDMAHGAYFSSQFANKWVGRFIGCMLLSPFTYWRDGHGYHHEHSNDLDYDQGSQSAPFTVADYRAMSRWQRAAYRFAAIPIIMVTMVSPFAMALLHPMRTNVAVEWAMQLSVWAFLWHHGMLWRLFATMGMASMLGVYLFHLQHTFEGAHRARGKDYYENGLYGSSYLTVPWWLSWATASIEVHHIHHLNARVPLYKLHQCHNEAPAGMWDGITRLTLSDGWRSLSLVLYDEAKGKLVTFAEAEADMAAGKGK